jgi:hypothetical protein
MRRNFGPKPKLSGAARRKLAKQKLMASLPKPNGDLMPRIKVGRLETVDEWRKEIGKVYRAMRTGTLRSDEGTKLTYVANVGAQLAKIEQELGAIEELRQGNAALRQQLAQSKNGGIPLLNGQTYLPASDSQQSEGDE